MGRPRKKINPELNLTLDFGGSGLKCIYQLRGKKSEVLFMESEIIEAEAESLRAKTKGLLGNVYPENMAWVGVGEDYRAVGYLATAQYHAIALMKPKKHSLAMYKTLAAVWVIQQRLNLPSRMEIKLALLLPAGELSDGQMLLKNLKAALSSFETPTGELNVQVRNLNCYAEGSGVYLICRENYGETIKKKELALIMIGYRNASILVSKKGMLTEAKSRDLGMIKYLESVMKQTSGLKPEQLIKAMAKAESHRSKKGESELNAQDFLNLTELHLSIELRKKQAEQILAALINSKSEYLQRLKLWLGEELPSEIEEVVFCGGTVDYLRKELDRLFPAIPVKWHGGFKYPEGLNEEWLGNRLADAYGLSKMFKQEMSKKYRTQEKVTA